MARTGAARRSPDSPPCASPPRGRDRANPGTSENAPQVGPVNRLQPHEHLQSIKQHLVPQRTVLQVSRIAGQCALHRPSARSPPLTLGSRIVTEGTGCKGGLRPARLPVARPTGVPWPGVPGWGESMDRAGRRQSPDLLTANAASTSADPGSATHRGSGPGLAERGQDGGTPPWAPPAVL